MIIRIANVGIYIVHGHILQQNQSCSIMCKCLLYLQVNYILIRLTDADVHQPLEVNVNDVPSSKDM